MDKAVWRTKKTNGDFINIESLTLYRCWICSCVKLPENSISCRCVSLHFLLFSYILCENVLMCVPRHKTYLLYNTHKYRDTNRAFELWREQRCVAPLAALGAGNPYVCGSMPLLSLFIPFFFVSSCHLVNLSKREASNLCFPCVTDCVLKDFMKWRHISDIHSD